MARKGVQAAMLYRQVRAGDRVTVQDPGGKRHTGTAQHVGVSGWVLSCKNNELVVATADNIIGLDPADEVHAT